MQHDKLHLVVGVVPYQDPKLPNRIYSLCFENLAKKGHFDEYYKLLRKLPAHLINQDALLEHLDRTVPTIEDATVFDIKFHLYKLNRDFDLALKFVVQRGDPHTVFDFLTKTKIELNLREYLTKLLKLDVTKTIEYLFQKYNPHTTVVLS